MFGRTADRLIALFGWRRGLRLVAQLRLAKIRRRNARIRLDIPILAAPAYVRARTTDALVVKELLFTGNFDFDMPADPRFIVDAGANIGLVSAYLATRFPEARIVALEIDAGNFDLLCANVRPYPNVTPMHAGLWSHATSLGLANPDAAPFAFRARESAPDAAGSRVPGYSVADLLQRLGTSQIDILKIDIEGGEREVFGPGSEAWVDRVALIAIELHDRFVPGCGEVVINRLHGRFTRRRSGELDVFVRAD